MPTFEPLEFTDKDFGVLEAWLLLCGKGISGITGLEGCLTALVVGPATRKPSPWIPKILGKTRHSAASRISPSACAWSSPPSAKPA